MDEKPQSISSKQCAAARALLGWTQGELAQKAGVGLSTVKGLEAGGHIHRSNSEKIQTAIEGAGVYPQHADIWGGEGVRFVNKNSSTRKG